METELQCTKAELSSFKDKNKRLQESYTSSQQANSVLEQKLQSVVDSMNSERKYHLHRIMELNKQLDTAKNTIISLESINVPSLIKELLDKHFDSQEAVRNFFLSSNSPGHPESGQSGKTSGLRESQSHGKEEERVSGWLFNGQRGLSERHQHVTAFLPWTESQDAWTKSEKTLIKQKETFPPAAPEAGESNIPFTVDDISQAIYSKIADGKATGHDTFSETEIHSFGMWRTGDVPANPYSLEEIGSNRVAGAHTLGDSSGNTEKNPNQLTYISAQKLLDNFMSQIPSPAQEGQLKKDHMCKDWSRRHEEGL
ncbi:uncharacterized protein si:ch211-276i12.4 [Hoplias malabaricus]|uniref:uncharacterized protein si:ch211-276i12.4 n=1 Tax=Hoplias malabaricus TaxID=27720 RepID=UPI0034626ED8